MQKLSENNFFHFTKISHYLKLEKRDDFYFLMRKRVLKSFHGIIVSVENSIMRDDGVESALVNDLCFCFVFFFLLAAVYDPNVHSFYDEPLPYPERYHKYTDFNDHKPTYRDGKSIL